MSMQIRENGFVERNSLDINYDWSKGTLKQRQVEKISNPNSIENNPKLKMLKTIQKIIFIGSSALVFTMIPLVGLSVIAVLVTNGFKAWMINIVALGLIGTLVGSLGCFFAELSLDECFIPQERRMLMPIPPELEHDSDVSYDNLEKFEEMPFGKNGAKIVLQDSYFVIINNEGEKLYTFDEEDSDCIKFSTNSFKNADWISKKYLELYFQECDTPYKEIDKAGTRLYTYRHKYIVTDAQGKILKACSVSDLKDQAIENFVRNPENRNELLLSAIRPQLA